MQRLEAFRGRVALVLALCLFGIGMAALPPFAAAITSQPLLGPVSATPSSTGATLNASIYPYGLATTYHFEYGPTAAYGTSVPIPAEDIAAAAYPTAVPVHQTVSGLASGATFHYRVSATNSMGTTTSPDQTFTTTGTPPTVTVAAATEVSGGFELSGTVNPNGSESTYKFEYGTTTAYGSTVPTPEASVGSGTSAVAVSQTVSSLLPNTTYHFRLVAHGGGSSAATSDQTFTTAPAPPSAPSAVVSAPQATATGYELRGAINPDSLATHYHFEYGTTTAYGTSVPIPDEDIGAGDSAVDVAKEIAGLPANTTYHYRIVATNSEGATASGDQAFTTAPPKPTVETLPVTESAAGFTLNAKVDPNGGATTYHFDFGITAAYGQSIPGTEVSVGSGNAAVAVSQLVTGLPPEVPYHYRVVATNAGGTTVGQDVFFMTPAAAKGGNPQPGGAQSTPVQTPVVPIAKPPASPPSSTIGVRPGAARNGAMTLKVTAPGAGTLVVSGKKLILAKGAASGAGVVPLKLSLTAAGKRALKKAPGRKLAVKVTIVFTPIGGTASVTHQTLTFR